NTSEDNLLEGTNRLVDDDSYELYHLKGIESTDKNLVAGAAAGEIQLSALSDSEKLTPEEDIITLLREVEFAIIEPKFISGTNTDRIKAPILLSQITQNPINDQSLDIDNYSPVIIIDARNHESHPIIASTGQEVKKSWFEVSAGNI